MGYSFNTRAGNCTRWRAESYVSCPGTGADLRCSRRVTLLSWSETSLSISCTGIDGVTRWTASETQVKQSTILNTSIHTYTKFHKKLSFENTCTEQAKIDIVIIPAEYEILRNVDEVLVHLSKRYLYMRHIKAYWYFAANCEINYGRS